MLPKTAALFQIFHATHKKMFKKKKFINSSPNVCIILYDTFVMSILSSGVDHVMPLDSGQTGTTMEISF